MDTQPPLPKTQSKRLTKHTTPQDAQMEAERLSFDDRLAGLEEEVARARREADAQGAEVEALKTQVRLDCP